jgi:NTE family protein
MKWALVLSGGGARGLAHIGVLKALERRGVPRPSFIAGTSMGAILGAMYANGWDAAGLESYALRFNLGNYMDNPAFKLPDYMLARFVQAGSALGSLIRGRSLDSGARALAEFERLFGETAIEDLPVPFACVSTDLTSGRAVVHDTGSVAAALRASMSFPGVFEPLRHGAALLVDGGIVDNLPCDIAARRGFRRILASDVSPFQHVDPSQLSNSMSILYRCFDIASENAQKALTGVAEVTITSYDGRSPFQFENIPSVIQLGERSADAARLELDRFYAKGSTRWFYGIKKMLTRNGSSPKRA